MIIFYANLLPFLKKPVPTIVESFLGIAEPFTSGILRKHFAGDTNLYPEETFKGKIIVMDFPVKEYLVSGVYAQGIFKLLWQQVLKGEILKNIQPPVFLWVDEAQLFLSDYDQIFQTTARSSRACTVYISQNISNYYVSIGGRDPRPKVDSLLGNLGTKIFHSNNDAVTNEWASRTIGKAFMNVSGISVGKNQSSSLNQQLHYLVEPREFTVLASGGQENEFKVEAIVTVAGKEWSDGSNFRKAIFKQNI
ncbi:MAG: TraM recognition domain-containing protein [Lewinellaceae bacterium]|nr:TraM recognition domain-containing protein [Lewinellaceae bacterium]